MILTVEELKVHTARIAQISPGLKDRTLLESPGCTPDECEYLRSQLPGLPDSFLMCIQRINVSGVSIGYFELSPLAPSGIAYTEAVISANSDLNPFRRDMAELGVIQVANCEVDPITVASAHSLYGEGRVVMMYIELGPYSIPRALARDFETFLLLAGNLDEVRADLGDDGAAALEGFSTVLDAFEVEGEEREVWESIAETDLLS